jgi:hypothetical protein
MPKFFATTRFTRRRIVLALGATLGLAGAASLPATALASRTQLAMIQDGSVLTNPDGAMQEFRQLGANTVRVVVPWAQVAPKSTAKKKPSFDATNPNAYPAANWATFDNIDRAAKKYGIRVDFTIAGGAPRWADGAAPPPAPNANAAFFAWKPNAAAYGQFVKAMGTRYNGHFTPAGQSSALPAVTFWAIFNEPNFGQDLGPQAINGSKTLTAPMYYRNLVNAGYSALKATGHAANTIVIGEFAAQGFEPGPPSRNAPQGLPGNFGQTRPLLFIRELYCVDAGYRELRGSVAKAVGCPTTAAASRQFRRQNPGLFNASGVADHPYPQGESPVGTAGNKPDFATFPDIPSLERTLDKVTHIYGSGKRYPIYNTEYAYITRPPKGSPYVSPATAAYYINWAEYLSWKSSRVSSYMQYLLKDPPSTSGVYQGFASGLEFANGKPKATYDAFRLPVYMPKTSLSRSTNAELWGDVRPAPFERSQGTQTVSVQLNGKTVKTVTVSGSSGYFDIHMKFAGSGSVRLAWTYPKTDPFLPTSDLGKTIHSRSFNIKVH